MVILNIDWLHYGLEGILLGAVLITLFIVQVWHYTWLGKRICRYDMTARHKQRQRQTETQTESDGDNANTGDNTSADNSANTDADGSANAAGVQSVPAVSIIVPLFTDDNSFLEEGLMRLLAQEYDDYEVVVVYVGMDCDFYDELMRMRLSFPVLRTTKIEARPRYPITPKMALNIGVKSARNPYIIITTADAVPSSNLWLANMARGFVYGDNVIGYCGIERRKGLLNRMMRTERLLSSAEWLAAAAAHRPYRGHKCNLGFARSLYFDVNGFGYLNMNVGEDDLFMQRIMTTDNTVVCISPEASMAEHLHGGAGVWLRRLRHDATTREFYPSDVRHALHIEPYSRLLFFLTAIIIFTVMPWEYCAAAALFVLARCIIVNITAARIARCTGEKGIAATYLIYDLLSLPTAVIARMVSRRKKEPSWRYTNIS